MGGGVYKGGKVEKYHDGEGGRGVKGREDKIKMCKVWYGRRDGETFKLKK